MHLPLQNEELTICAGESSLSFAEEANEPYLPENAKRSAVLHPQQPYESGLVAPSLISTQGKLYMSCLKFEYLNS